MCLSQRTLAGEILVWTRTAYSYSCPYRIQACLCRRIFVDLLVTEGILYYNIIWLICVYIYIYILSAFVVPWSQSLYMTVPHTAAAHGDDEQREYAANDLWWVTVDSYSGLLFRGEVRCCFYQGRLSLKEDNQLSGTLRAAHGDDERRESAANKS